MYNMMYWMMGNTWGYGIFGGVIELLIVVLLVLLIVFMWQKIQRKK